MIDRGTGSDADDVVALDIAERGLCSNEFFLVFMHRSIGGCGIHEGFGARA